MIEIKYSLDILKAVFVGFNLQERFEREGIAIDEFQKFGMDKFTVEYNKQNDSYFASITISNGKKKYDINFIFKYRDNQPLHLGSILINPQKYSNHAKKQEAGTYILRQIQEIFAKYLDDTPFEFDAFDYYCSLSNESDDRFYNF